MRFQLSPKPSARPKTVSDPLRGFRIAMMGLLIFLAYLTLGRTHAAGSLSGRSASPASSGPAAASGIKP